MSTTPKYWFAARADGKAWVRPITWQGWLVFAVWFVALVAVIPYLNARQYPVRALLAVIGMVLPLAGICYWKGEPLHGFRQD